MNGYERMLATLAGERVDYTPSMEIMIDESVVRAVTGKDDYMALCDTLELDAVITTTPSKLYRSEILDAEKGIFRNEWGTVRRQGREVVSAIEMCIRDSHGPSCAYAVVYSGQQLLSYA